MKRICIIGDFSVAALKVAWDKIGVGTPDVTLTFFAAPGRLIGGLVADSGVLVPGSDVLRQHLIRKSGGFDRIDPANFDAYILSGMQLDALYVSRVGAELEQQQVTDEVVLDAACDRVADTIHGQTVRKLRECTQNPALIIPKPLRVINPQKPFWEIIKASSSGTKLAHLFESACERYAARMGCRFLPQPKETRGETDIDTLAEFAQAGARLRLSPTDDDFTHMNGAFGEIVLRAALTMLNR